MAIVRLTGFDAIEHAEYAGIETLCKFEDAADEARTDVSIEEALEIADGEPGVIYLDVEESTVHPANRGGIDAR